VAPLETSSRPVGRLAPSPTGELHLGHARTFLLAFWHTRSRGGHMRLRIDDLDAERLRPGMSERALEDLEWLGLTWEGEVLWQSKRSDAYRAVASQLLAQGLAFPCVCSRSELERVQSAPHTEDRELRYPGTCRARFASWEAAQGVSGGAAVRFQTGTAAVSVSDAFAGLHEFDVQREVGDFVILRRDGAASYQLATVVDDAAQGVTEVVRGDDLLPSAARQTLLYQSLDLPTPEWVHVPLVVDEQGQRLAKRNSPLSLLALRQAGVDPRAVVKWVANSVGIPSSERVRAEELVPEFRLERVPQGIAQLSAEAWAQIRS